MIKNVFIAFLVLLLVIAGIFVARDLSGEMEVADENIEGARDVLGKELEKEEEANTEFEVGLLRENEMSIVGRWQKNDDSQSILMFQSDGTLIDSYGGGVVYEVGTYSLFDTANDLPQGVEHRSGTIFLRQTFGDETYYYELYLVDDNSLELLPLSGDTRTLKYLRLDS